MADVNVKMGVSGISQFKQGITDASASVKRLDAELKANEKQLKATGNAENYMQTQTQLLNGKLEAQRNIVKNAEQALKQLDQNGVKKTSAAYQNMQRQLIEAQSAMMDTQAEIDGLGNKAAEASGQTDKLASSLGGIGKKLSLDQVIGGIDSITNAMERAGRKAVELGKQIWDNVMDSARLSDDILTQATMLDMTPEQYQQYKGYFDTLGEITVTEWAAAKRKIEKAMVGPSSEQIDILKALGFTEVKSLGYGQFQEALKLADNWEDVFWEVGTELRKRVENGTLSNEMADVYGEAIFGKKYSSLKNLIKGGREAFEEGIKTINTASDEALEKDAALNDQMIKLKASFDALKIEVTSALAPALTDAAKALDGLLGSVLEYLKTPEGKQALEDLGTAVSGLFDDLGKIDPETVVQGFTGVLNTVVDSVKWLVDNKDGVVEALKWILGGWGTLEVTGGVLEIVKVVQGIKGLTNTSAAAAAGEAAGASWGGGFAKAVMAAAPWLIGLYTLLNPSAGSDETGNNTLINEKGEITAEGQAAGLTAQDVQKIDAAAREIKDAKQTVKEMTGLTEEQITALKGYWTYESQYMEKGGNVSDEIKQLRTSRFNTLMDLFGEGNPQLAGYLAKMRMMTNAGEYGNLDWSFFNINGEGVEVPLDLKVPDDEAEQISGQVGTVVIPAQLAFGGGGGGMVDLLSEFIRPRLFANGIWSVPFDGYSAILHKGERVVPAREVGSSRNFSSNLYIENMNMNNGQDAEGLAAAIAAANRRTMRGYGN